MKKYMLIVFLLVCFVMVAQNASAVDLPNAENCRIEVTAEPAYEQAGDRMVSGLYYGDISIVNNSNDVINLEGLEYHIFIRPLEPNITAYRTTMAFLGGRPEVVVVQPHSKALLKSFRAQCWIEENILHEEGSATVKYSRPANDVLITVNGSYGNQAVFSSSVHARYKKVHTIMYDEEPIQLIRAYPEKPTQDTITSGVASVRFNNFPKGLSSDEEDDEEGEKRQ